MAKARKCDVCGDLYEVYNTFPGNPSGNGFSFIRITDSDYNVEIL